MNISPQEFYRMDIEDFILKANGFTESRLWLEGKLRRATEIIHRPHVQKSSPSIMNLWPMSNDKKNQELAREFISEENKKTLELHKLGGFEYIMEKGKIIMHKTSQN